MHDLSLLSEAQKRRIEPYLPLSHDIPRVDDRGYSAGSLSSSGMDCVGAMYLATTPPHMTMRYMRGHFIVTGPDIEPVMFKSHPEAREWCAEHHPGSPIREVGANSSKRATKPKSQELE